jgi:GT2 family glycosyltransferase
MNTQKLRALPYVALLLPADIVVAMCLLGAMAAAPFLRNRRGKAGAAPSGNLPSDRLRPATIQILNWDGRELLAHNLPSVIAAARAAGKDHRVVVVDNGSTDGSVAFVRQHFPEVEIVQLDRNYGFVEGNNRGIQRAKTDVVVLLNNDMTVDRHFLTPLLEGFTDDSVFAVTSQIFFEDSARHRAETGKTRGRFDRGFFTVWHADIHDADQLRAAIPVFWAGGGSCAIDKAKYIEIGGLDDLYHPFYVEDTDLSYQAWKRGWKCLLAPSSRVVHKHRATSSRKFSTEFVDNTIRRNLYLFVWKNVTDGAMLLEHILNLPRIHGRAVMSGNGGFEVRAYLRACLKLPAALVRRFRNMGRYVIGDRDVLARSAP